MLSSWHQVAVELTRASVAFLTKSLALMADAFHYVHVLSDPVTGVLAHANLSQLNDLVGFVVALTALIVWNTGEANGAAEPANASTRFRRGANPPKISPLDGSELRSSARFSMASFSWPSVLASFCRLSSASSLCNVG